MGAQLIASKYEILAELGQGGMGRVYKVLHRGLHKVYALKMLHAHLASDKSLIARFHNEARIMASLHHRNIIQVFDIDHEGDQHYFVMEYVEGLTLSDVLKGRAPLPITEAIGISRQISAALAYAHQRQPPVIHRDVKPSNIMLESDTGRVVVTDFGIAKLLDTERTRHTLTGFTVGTPGYAAPEQLRSVKDIDGRADIFPLGLVLYEMLAGRSCFEDMTPEEIIGQKLYDPRELAPGFNPSVPNALQGIIRRAIAKNREQRYPSVTALLDDLNRFESDGMVHGTAATDKPDRTRYWLAAAAVAMIAGYGIWTFLRSPELGPSSSTTKSTVAEPAIPEGATPEAAGAEPASIEPESTQPLPAETVAAESTAFQPIADEITEPEQHSGFPPVIIDSEPPSDTISLDSGDEQLFRVEAVDPDERSVSYQWFLDDQPVAAGEHWVYRPDSNASGTYVVRVEVSNQSNGRVEQAWRIDVREPLPPPTLTVSPSVTTLTMTACSAETFSVDNASDFNGFRWLLDSDMQSGQGAWFTFEPRLEGVHSLEVHASAGTDTITHRWRIDVEPLSIGEAEVSDWIERYRQALQDQDVEALRQLGDLFSETELAQLHERQRYQLTLERWNAIERDGVVDLSFSQVERWYDPKTYSSVVEHNTHTLTLMRQGCGEITGIRNQRTAPSLTRQ